MIVLDRKAKQFVFHYNVDHCLFCAQCVHSCRQGCLEMQPQIWELAALSRDGYQLYYGADDAVKAYLASHTEPESGEALRPAAQPVTID